MEELSHKKNHHSHNRLFWQWLVIFTVTAVLTFSIVYLVKSGTMVSNSSIAQNSPGQNNILAADASSQTIKITIRGDEYAFDPNSVQVNKGATIELNFINTGMYPHNLAIADLNVKTKVIQPGEQDTVTFTANKTGTFTYICTVPGHADRGMTGTLSIQ